MRRNEKEISARAEIDSIIRRSQVCRLGMADGREAYIVPLCFGYDGKALYFHCATGGRKLDMLRCNNRVCFEFDLVQEMVQAEQACQWGIRYQSVIGFGVAHVLQNADEKRQALAIIMKQYSDKAHAFPDDAVDRTAVIKVVIEKMSGKQSLNT